jgi:N-acetylneuraminic acid mutarotase
MEVRGRRVLCIAFLCKFLYRLDLETFIWKELESRGTIPDTSRYKMEYYNGSLYLFAGSTIFIYDLNMENWSKIETSNEVLDSIILSAQCFYKQRLYNFMGWDYLTGYQISSMYMMDLSNDKYEVKELLINLQYLALNSFGYTCINGILYLFGGFTENGYSNSLAVLDLSQSNLKLEILSEDMNVPTPRLGHAMEVYNDQLYIFGGADADSNK